MIKRKKKTCKGCQKERILFGRGLCPTCYRIEMAKKARLKPPKPRSPSKGANVPPNRDRPQNRAYAPLNRMSDKRKREGSLYLEICKEMDKISPHTCFFCGKEIKGRPDHHHLSGRQENYLKEEWIVKAHGKCHRQYHDDPVESMDFFESFLLRLKKKNFQLYQRELYKLDK